MNRPEFSDDSVERMLRPYSMNGGQMQFNYRHWFFISLLILINVVIFGMVFLAVLGKMYFGG
jgi:hypothetical protein